MVQGGSRHGQIPTPGDSLSRGNGTISITTTQHSERPREIRQIMYSGSFISTTPSSTVSASGSMQVERGVWGRAYITPSIRIIRFILLEGWGLTVGMTTHQLRAETQRSLSSPRVQTPERR